MNLYAYKSFPIELKDVDKSTNTVQGYFSSFNFVDAHKDIMRPGAFAKTIQEMGPAAQRPRTKHLLNHDVNMPIGKLLDLKEDGFGLFYVSQVGTNNTGQDFLKMAESGLITEHSVGFSIVKENRLKPWHEAKDGEAANEILEVKLYEGSSLTGWGANEHTPLIPQLKSLDAINSRIKRLEKFVRDTDATDETIQLLLIEIRQLNQVIIDLQSKTTEPQKSTQPEQVDWSIVGNKIKSLLN